MGLSEGGLPANILIVGAAKSGTTALFYAVQNALRARGIAADGLFEPKTAEKVREYLRSTSDPVPFIKVLLAKFLRARDGGQDLTSLFEKRVLICRDPRDVVISRLHFRPPSLIAGREPAKAVALMELFRRKEQAPDSISVCSMVRQVEEIVGEGGLLVDLRRNAVLPATLKREVALDYFVMPYDDLVTGRFEALSAYLGLPISSDFELSPEHTTVARSKASGAWRDWFLDEDVAFFTADCAADYRDLGYDPEERPHEVRRIDPATCSEYVRKRIDFHAARTPKLEKRMRRARLRAKEAGGPVSDSALTEAREARRARRIQLRERMGARAGG